MSGDTALALACRTSGEGPPLMVVHGLFGSGTNWRGLARHWASRFTVHLVDARNHGDSPHAEVMDYTSMAGDLIALLDRIAPDGAHILGHSMGGKIAMMTALLEPERVRSLLVADVAPVTYTHDFDKELNALRALPLDALERRADADRLLAEHLPDAGLRAFLLQNLVLSDGRFRWRINLDAIEAGIGDLTDFVAPAGAIWSGDASFIRGGRSSYVTDTHLDAARALFPGLRVATVDEAGHWLHAEQPQAFAAAVDAHFESLSTT